MDNLLAVIAEQERKNREARHIDNIRLAKDILSTMSKSDKELVKETISELERRQSEEFSKASKDDIWGIFPIMAKITAMQYDIETCNEWLEGKRKAKVSFVKGLSYKKDYANMSEEDIVRKLDEDYYYSANGEAIDQIAKEQGFSEQVVAVRDMTKLEQEKKRNIIIRIGKFLNEIKMPVLGLGMLEYLFSYFYINSTSKLLRPINTSFISLSLSGFVMAFMMASTIVYKISNYVKLRLDFQKAKEKLEELGIYDEIKENEEKRLTKKMEIK